MEALSRLNILSATIGGGAIGAQVLNDIEARKSWLAAFRETAVFFNEHLPFEITFDPSLIQDGEIDYQHETVDLAMCVALDPSEAGWTALNALLNGLENTGKRQTWGFSGWPFLDIKPSDSGVVVFSGKRSLNFKIDVALLNATGRTIGRSSVALNTGAFRFAVGDKVVSLPERVLDLVHFPKVDAKYLTPILTVAINAVNEIPANILNSSGYIKISAGDLENRMRQWEAAIELETRQQEMEAAELKRQWEIKKQKTVRKIAEWLEDDAKLLSIGANIGTSFATPLLIGNINITVPAFRYTFFELGCDYGLFHGGAGGDGTNITAAEIESIGGIKGAEGIEDVEYNSWFPYLHFNFFAPFNTYGGWYFGLGGGYYTAEYTYPENKDGKADSGDYTSSTFDVATGFYFGKENHLFRIDLTLRTNFTGVNHKTSIGYTYRFR
jgi:hypothetical protein